LAASNGKQRAKAATIGPITGALLAANLLMALALAMLTVPATAADKPGGAPITLRVASSWDTRQHFTREFLKFIDDVNTAGAGLIRLDYLGGPEVMPQRQLLYALRRGVVDMTFGSITYYRGLIPEGDAIYASSITPTEARASGALDALQPYWKKRINARLLSWLQSGIGVNFYLTAKPRFGEDGMPDLSGLKIRTSPSNREVVTEFGARAVQIALKEVYTALQRGTVDGIIFTTTGLPDLSVQEFIRYRVDPALMQFANTVQINLDAWNRLPDTARRLLERIALVHEARGRARFEALHEEELVLLRKQGLVAAPVAQHAARQYQERARDVAWDRLARRAPASARRLRPLFVPEERP
jgi:TRAP-type C4-dicarboxylate transport system substrate-binding protein